MSLEEFKKTVTSYGNSNGYPPTEFELITCSCNHNLFMMYSDDTEGACEVTCANCDKDISIENSAEYMENAERNICTCESETLYVLVAKAYYQDSTDIRWIYVGGMCPDCNLSGVYVDWAER